MMVWRKNCFVALWFLLLILGAFGFIWIQEGDAVRYLNGHPSFWNDAFVWITKMGEAIVIVPLIMLLLFVRFGAFLTVAISSGLASMAASVLKKMVFPGFDRPSFVLEEPLNLVPGVELHHHFSMPSGHTTAAFALFTALALQTKHHVLQILCFSAGFGVAISRVYLVQHFYRDVYFGALIGGLIALVTYLVINQSKLKEQSWWNKSLLRLSI